jgi:hypothetical protein
MHAHTHIHTHTHTHTHRAQRERERQRDRERQREKLAQFMSLFRDDHAYVQAAHRRDVRSHGPVCQPEVLAAQAQGG